MINWLNAREATEVGAALADAFVLQRAAGSGAAGRKLAGAGTQPQQLQTFLQKFLQRVDREASPLKLNFFKRAKLANSFKWRLIEKGVEPNIVDELTQALVLRLSADPSQQPPSEASAEAASRKPARAGVAALLQEGYELHERGEDAAAIDCFEEALRIDPRNAIAQNNLGIALCKVGRYHEGESRFRQALGIKEAYADAQFNLGTLLQLLGHFSDAETPLRRAVKLQPSATKFQSALGINLLITGKVDESRRLIEKVLLAEPANAHALLAMGQLAARQGRFADAETMFKRTLEVNANTHGAWTGLVSLRKMTSADSAWLKGAQACADSGLDPVSEADLRYAVGKYYDDLGEFSKAFRSYERANELSRTGAARYDRNARSRLTDDLIRVYTREALSQNHPRASDSALPVLVTGMPRSGTSLVEQIVASHPAAKGAGELLFWARSFRRSESALRQGSPSEALTKKLVPAYLRVLNEEAPNAQRVVDKRPSNSDFLGIIHCAFPQARFIYLRRDPIDTCLSCFFQSFPPVLTFTKDLGDLAHYYREHHRLMEHWRRVLPAGTLLDVPYEELVADQEGWTRRIVDFIGLEWDDRCLSYHATERRVLTASYWQVRQKLYKTSIGRWRNYQRFIGPLLELKGLN